MLVLLKTRKKMSRRELANKLEVDVRQISRYKEALCMAGINIKEERGRYGGYSIDKESSLIAVGLSEDEAIALKLGINYLERGTFPLKEDFNSGILKILADYGKDNDKFCNNCAVAQHKRINRYNINLKDKWKIVNNSISNKKKIKIRYSNMNDEEMVRVIHPYGIYIYEGASYIVAFCEYRNEVRNFKLVRILNLEELDEDFKDDDFDVKSYLKRRIGIYSDTNKYDIKLKIHYPYAKCFKEHIWVEKDQFEDYKEEGYIIYNGLIEGKPDIVKWILEMGSSCEVLEPKEIKDAVMEECKKIIKLYN